jgi:8-oxo-dGTP diphosphatase
MFAALPHLPPEQRWRQQYFPAPIVVALIQREATVGTTQYLLIRRNGAAYGGQWALVGGKWDFGETLAEAIVREVKEETDLDTRFLALRGIVNERVTAPEPAESGAHFLLFVCELAAGIGRAQEQQEGELAWFSTSDIEALHDTGAIIPSDYMMIQKVAGTERATAVYEAEMISNVKGDGPTHLVSFKPL